MRLEAAYRRLAVEMQPHRGDEAEVIELHRAQAVRNLAHALQHELRRLDAVAYALLRLRVRDLARQRLEVEADARQDLADLVVQFA